MTQLAYCVHLDLLGEWWTRTRKEKEGTWAYLPVHNRMIP